jgi:hypothetical protein
MDILLKLRFERCDNKEWQPKDLQSEFGNVSCDLVPRECTVQDLFDVFDFIDHNSGKTGKIKQEHIEDTFENFLPSSEVIMIDILEDGTEASREDIQNALRGIPNFKKLKGKIVQNPFVKVMISPPISMSRLDANFLA